MERILFVGVFFEGTWRKDLASAAEIMLFHRRNFHD
jgi:hypothetical protein